jgi:hypothetical protein
VSTTPAGKPKATTAGSTASRLPEQRDNREPLRNAEVDAVANLDGCWHLSFRETKPEFLGLLIEAIEFLDKKSEFMH